MTTLRRNVIGLAVLVVTVVATVTASAPVGSAPQWASAATATVHPGVQTRSPSGQCTANFVFYDAANVYIGQAAHCTGLGGSTETNGCESRSHPLGTPVTVRGASRPGTLAYSSWLTMQAVGEDDPDVCQFNDFALVRLDPADVGKVNPSIPHWGGPAGLNTTGTALLHTVYSYGNSSLRLGLTVLSPKKGVSIGDAGDGWTHLVHMITPDLPGDSGSAYLDARGRALGLLSTLNVVPPSLGVTDLARSLAYMRAHTALNAVQLALGTVPFNGNRLPLGL